MKKRLHTSKESRIWDAREWLKGRLQFWGTDEIKTQHAFAHIRQLGDYEHPKFLVHDKTHHLCILPSQSPCWGWKIRSWRRAESWHTPALHTTNIRSVSHERIVQKMHICMTVSSSWALLTYMSDRETNVRPYNIWQRFEHTHQILMHMSDLYINSRHWSASQTIQYMSDPVCKWQTSTQMSSIDTKIRPMCMLDPDLRAEFQRTSQTLYGFPRYF